MVSICMITYNHQNYIEQALKSIFSQNVNFDFEVIIGDDFSSDSTVSIIERFNLKYPGKIIPVLRKENVGMMNNFADVLQRAKGKYIALLEGDDYWTDPTKLQKQVDFLEANPGFVISYTDYSQTEEGSGLITDQTNLYHKEVLTVDDLLENNYVSTLTCVFRNNLFDEFPEGFSNLKVGDWPLHVLNAQYGKIKYHKGWVSGVYRIHAGGVWSGQNKITKSLAYAEVYEFFKQILENKYHKKIKQKFVGYYYSAASLYLAQENKKEARFIIKKMARETSVFNLKYLKIKLKHYLT